MQAAERTAAAKRKRQDPDNDPDAEESAIEEGVKTVGFSPQIPATNSNRKHEGRQNTGHILKLSCIAHCGASCVSQPVQRLSGTAGHWPEGAL